MASVGIRFDFLDWLVTMMLWSAFVWMLVVKQDYTHRMPQGPDLKMGRVLPFSASYGRTVFINSAEEAWVTGTYVAFAVAGGCFYLGVVQRRVWRGRRRASRPQVPDT